VNPWRRVGSVSVSALAAIIAVLLACGAPEAATLAIDFQNPRTLYAATERGTFKSVDQGDTWAPRNAGFSMTARPLFVNLLVMVH